MCDMLMSLGRPQDVEIVRLEVWSVPPGAIPHSGWCSLVDGAPL
jgi:hypothetical protein